MSLTSQDPYNNVVRTAVEALALPTEASARIARNTQLILREETGITRVADPLAGSYYVESLTASLAAAARTVIGEVEALGGMTKAVTAGMPKLRIEEAAARRQARVDRGEDVIVGVNRYAPEGAAEVEILDIDNSAVREAQVARLGRVRAARAPAPWRSALAALEACAQSGEGNLLGHAMEAARARATVGEISDALERVWTRHRAVTPSITGVYGAAWEGDEGFARIRAAVEAFAREEGRRPRMLVASSGRTGTTAAPGSSPPRSRTWASMWTWVRCSRPRRRRHARRSRTTCTSWGCRRRRRGTRPWFPLSSRRYARRMRPTSRPRRRKCWRW